METPALISAIVQDVQRAQIGGIEKQDVFDEPDYKEIEIIIPVPQVQMNVKQNKNVDSNNPDDLGKPTTVGTNVTVEAEHPMEPLGMDLDKVEDFNSRNLPQKNIEMVASLETKFKKEQTPPTVPISQESPSPGVHVSGTPLPIIRELTSPDSKPTELDVRGVESQPELNNAEVEERRFASLWSPGVVEDQPIVYMPPPVVETECVEELEELANVGRTERQVVGIASSHHLSAMYDHHHHHDDIKKHVRELPLDSEPVRHSSDDKKTHDEVSSHKLDHRSAADSPEVPPGNLFGNLFRVPSVLEQMVEEPPPDNRALFRVPSVLEQMMDEPPAEPVDNVPTPPDVDEYRLDSGEFVSDKQEGSSHSHHALHMPGSAMAAVTTCRDLHFRDSEAGFVLGDTEVAPAAEGNSSFSEASEGENSNEENCEFPLDEQEQVELSKTRPSQDDEEVVGESPIVSSSNGGNENDVASNEKQINETSVEAKETESDKKSEPMLNQIPQISDMFSNPDQNVHFYIGDQHEDTPEYNGPLNSREENLDNNFYSEGQPEKLAENVNKVEGSFNEANDKLSASPRETHEIGELSSLVAPEPKIPTLNELFNNEEEEPDFAEDVVDDYWALEEPGDNPMSLDYGGLETSEESHHRDELLRPKPPPGRSERGCISAR